MIKLYFMWLKGDWDIVFVVMAWWLRPYICTDQWCAERRWRQNDILHYGQTGDGDHFQTLGQGATVKATK